MRTLSKEGSSGWADDGGGPHSSTATANVALG
jgi:hypothetical protein